MKTRAFLVVVSALVCLAAVWFALDRRRLAREAAASLATFGRLTAARRGEIDRWRKQLAESDRINAGLETALAAARVAKQPGARFVSDGKAGDLLPFSVKEILQNDPKLQVLHLAAERVAAQRRYGAFLHRAGLSTEQEEKFIAAVMRHQEQMLDLDSVVQAQALPADDAAIAALRKGAEAELSDAQLGLLGAELFQRLQSFERTYMARAVVDVIAGRLAFSDSQITADQAEQLVQIIAEASRGYQAGGKVDVPDVYRDAMNNPLWSDAFPDPIDWESARKKARAVLTESQARMFEVTTAQFNIVKIVNLIQSATREIPRSDKTARR